MTEENTNYAWGCATVLALLLAFGGMVYYYEWLRERSTESKRLAKEEQLRLRQQREESERLESEEEMRRLLQDFYSKCFAVKRLKCSPYQKLLLEIEFTNRTMHSIEAVLIGITFYDRLGNRIVNADLRLVQKVHSNETIRYPFNISGITEFNALCKLGMEQLFFQFSGPFARVQTNQYQAQSYRSSDVVISFTDGAVVGDLKGSFWTSDQVKKSIAYLRLR